MVGEVTRQYARPAEITSIDGLFESARRAISRETGDFESYLDEIKGLNSIILWRQDWFVVDVFRRLATSPHLFTNDAGFDELILAGKNALQADDIERLREVVGTLQSRRIDWGGDIEMALTANVVKG